VHGRGPRKSPGIVGFCQEGAWFNKENKVETPSDATRRGLLKPL
jgi:hypothetical protein